MIRTSHNSPGLLRRAPGSLRTARVELFAATAAARQARDWAAAWLAQAEPQHNAELVDAAVLVISELVTNAVRAVLDPPRRCRTRPAAAVLPNAVSIFLVISDIDQAVRIEVHDRSCVPLHPAGHADHDGETGRGLLVIDALATDWGWCPSPYGKMVWCVLDDAVVRAVSGR